MSFVKQAAARALLLHRLNVSVQQRHQPFSIYAVNYAQNDDARGGRGGAGAAAVRSPPGQPQQMPQAQQQQLRQQQQDLQQEVQKARPSSQPGQHGGSGNRGAQEASLGIRQAAGQIEQQRQQQLQQHNVPHDKQAQGQQYGQQQQQQQQQQQRGGQQQQGMQQQQNNRAARGQREEDDADDHRDQSREPQKSGSRGRNASGDGGRQMQNRGNDDNDDGGEGHGRPPDRIKPNRYLKKAPTGLIESFNADFPGRDTKNFPRSIPPRYPPELRHFFIPRGYFDFFYDKTGATGGYTFGGSFITFLISKEFFIFEHEANMFVPLTILVWAFCKYAGPHINKYCQELYNTEDQRLITFQEKSMDFLQEELDLQDNRVYSAEASIMLAQAKRENVGLQQEALYRQHLKTAYDEVKKRLDYMVAVQNAQRRAEKKHMMQWVLDNVRQSLTEQSEKESLRACVDALAHMKPSQ